MTGSVQGLLTCNGVLPTEQPCTDFDWANVVLLLTSISNTIYDASDFQQIVTQNDVQVLSTQSIYAGTSMYFNKTANSYLKIANDVAAQLGTGDFTIEFWFYTPESLNQGLVSSEDASASAGGFLISKLEDGGGAEISFKADSGERLASTSYALNTWHFVQLTRQAGLVRLWLNGVLSSPSSYTWTDSVEANPLYIGVQENGPSSRGNQFLGYMEQLRITKGVVRDSVVPGTAFSICRVREPTFGVIGRSNNAAIFTTNLIVNVPPARAGDLILVVAWTGSTINGPGSATGYQRIGYVNVGGNNTGLGVFVRDATGTGDGCTIVNPNGGWLSAMSWVIEKASANSVGVVVNNNPGGGVNVPFPAVTFQPDVAGATDFLAIVAAQLVSAVTSITSYPAGYTQGRANFNVNGGNLAVAEKLCTAPGETPGNMVINTNDAWTTITITIANNDPSPARGVVSPIPGIYLSDDVLSPATASASLSINNQGLISVTGNGSLVNSPSRWYNPATSDIGNSFYYKLTVVSGTGPSSGNLTGVWLAPMFNNYLGWPASYSWTWTKATNGVNVATCRLDISTAGTDGTIVATETFNVLVNRDI